MKTRVLICAGVTALLVFVPVPKARAGTASPGGFCGTPDADALVGEAQDQSDCAQGRTVIRPEYAPGALFRIPVVFHVIEGSDGTGHLDPAVIESQMAVLNQDFQAIPGSPGAPGIDSRIEFVLASVDPSGNPTPGIEYVTNDEWMNDPGFFQPSPMKQALSWDANRYLNIYTVNEISGGAKGYATGPWLAQGQPRDGVVLLWSVIGPDYGDIGAHEVGHYLALFHTFQGGCGDPAQPYVTGDVIADTNPEATLHQGCPDPPPIGCGGFAAPIHNYMNYTNPDCRNEFTLEQANRMRCALINYRAALYTGGGGGGPCTNCPPVAPTGLVARAPWNSDTQVDLEWVDNSQNEDYFVLGRRVAGSGGAFEPITPHIPGNTTSFTDTGIAPFTSYDYRISAHNGHGASPYATTHFHARPNEAATTGGAGAAYPGAPINTLTPTVTWTAVPRATSYQVRVIETDGPANWEAFVAGSPFTVPDSWPLRADTRYHFKVQAENENGEGPYSDLRFFVPFWVPPRLSISDASLLEGDDAGVPDAVVSVSVPHGTYFPLTVQYATADGSALAGEDYVTTSGVVSFAPDEQVRTVSIPVVGDRVYERNDTFFVNLANPSGATIADGQGQVTIVNDDPAPTVSIDDVTVVEGNIAPRPPNEAVFTVSLAGETRVPASVSTRGEDCTAYDAVDYSAAPGTLQFPLGITQRTVHALVYRDNEPEGNKTFSIRLTGATDATIGDDRGEAIIQDDDGPGPSNPRADFNGDLRTDILWRHQGSGRMVAWFMDGLRKLDGQYLTPDLSDLNWKVVGTGDFDVNVDGTTDILWRNDVSGKLSIWLMDGLNQRQGVLLDPSKKLSWKVAGTGDFDRDGKVDIVWRDDTSGSLDVWLMNGTDLRLEAPLVPGALTDLNWKIVGTGDMNRDGNVDILWRHDVSNVLVVWFMDGLNKVDGVQLVTSGLPDQTWKVAGMWDVDRDGTTDILWRNETSGRLVVWFMGQTAGTKYDTTQICGAFLIPDRLADLNWKIVGPR